jgi:hypothetical protein
MTLCAISDQSAVQQSAFILTAYSHDDALLAPFHAVPLATNILRIAPGGVM